MSFTPDTESSYIIGPCSDSDFETVKRLIQVFELDSRQLLQEEFLTATVNGVLAGFGRVREYADFSEMCSLGIVPGQRQKGLGTAIALKLAEKARQTIYMVCIIPSFFEKHGFFICGNYPEAIRQKLDYCRQSFPVPEPYVVMTR